MVPWATTKLIDLLISIGRMSRFMDLPEVLSTPPSPSSPPLLAPRWRTAGPIEDPNAPLLELRGAAFTWGEAQTGVEASKRNNKARPCNLQANLYIHSLG